MYRRLPGATRRPRNPRAGARRRTRRCSSRGRGAHPPRPLNERVQQVQNRSRRPIDKRILAAGALVGAALGVWVGNRTREFRQTGALPKLIDWGQVSAIAAGMNRGEAMGPAERASLAAEYRRLVERCIGPIAEYTCTALSRPFEAVLAFDRAEWVRANIAHFEQPFAPLEDL